MTSVYDVPADALIGKLSGYLKENIKEVSPPEWAFHVKTGAHVERVPQRDDWWFTRSASILRKLYIKGPVGVQSLRKEYGGRERQGNFPAHHGLAGGSIIRASLQQLEKAGLVARVEKQGRVVTPKGRSMLDAVSTKIKKDLEKERPELKNY